MKYVQGFKGGDGVEDVELSENKVITLIVLTTKNITQEPASPPIHDLSLVYDQEEYDTIGCISEEPPHGDAKKCTDLDIFENPFSDPFVKHYSGVYELDSGEKKQFWTASVTPADAESGQVFVNYFGIWWRE